MGIVGIELEAAVQMILEQGQPVSDVEAVETLEAGGRILAEDMAADFDNPPFPRSPLDGYALRSREITDASAESPVTLCVIASVFAGQWPELYPYGDWEQPRAAVRIMTGAPIPEGFDCVVRQEDVTAEHGVVTVFAPLKPYENYCFQGEDFEKSAVLLKAGTKLNYIHLGILASAGYQKVRVYRLVRAALFVTGDEVVEPLVSQNGESHHGPPNGKIYDSNLYLLYGRLRELGVQIVKKEFLPDDPSYAAAAIRSVCDDVDVILTTGGVSVGEKDIFHQVLPELGVERLFWKVRLKPGTPAMFSVVRGALMLNLSGNPFAAATTFELLAVPLLSKLGRDPVLTLVRSRAVLQNDFGKASAGRRFLRGRLSGGRVWIPGKKKHSSGILSSMADCNCLIDVSAGTGELRAGDEVQVMKLPCFCEERFDTGDLR